MLVFFSSFISGYFWVWKKPRSFFLKSIFSLNIIMNYFKRYYEMRILSNLRDMNGNGLYTV
uniref:Uncharacterized protein n=1 Tax=Anguilla anguilla TaxID=7936 RepID=A0A0E9WJ57_ANGAN